MVLKGEIIKYGDKIVRKCMVKVYRLSGEVTTDWRTAVWLRYVKVMVTDIHMKVREVSSY